MGLLMMALLPAWLSGPAQAGGFGAPPLASDDDQAPVGQGARPAGGAERDACLRGGEPEPVLHFCSVVIAARAAERPSDVAAAYMSRGLAFAAQGRFDRALADLNQAIAIDSGSAAAYNGRAGVHLKMKQFDQAIADSDAAIGLKPDFALAYENRGRAWFLKGDPRKAVADLDQAIALKPTPDGARAVRGMVFEKQDEREKALDDFRSALAQPAAGADAKQLRGEILSRLAALTARLAGGRERQDGSARENGGPGEADQRYADEGQAALRQEPRRPEDLERRMAAMEAGRPAGAPAAVVEAPAAPAAPGRRVALVIANAAYQGFPALKNPANDGRDMAAALRRLGFAEVIELYDAGRAQMEQALKDFGDRTTNADWAVVFYSGHGIQLDGRNYLIPVDAKLLRAKHVEDEAVSLERVRDKVGDARALRLVILDACRNNPFQARMMAEGGKKSVVGRGLSRVEPSAGELVAFATREGHVADDGAERNSPFTTALLAHIERPGLELSMMFRKVRDAVLKTTNNAQEPYTYGALPGSEFYFSPPVAAASNAP